MRNLLIHKKVHVVLIVLLCQMRIGNTVLMVLMDIMDLW